MSVAGGGRRGLAAVVGQGMGVGRFGRGGGGVVGAGIAAEVVEMRDRRGRCGRRRSRDGTGSQPWSGMGR